MATVKAMPRVVALSGQSIFGKPSKCADLKTYVARCCTLLHTAQVGAFSIAVGETYAPQSLQFADAAHSEQPANAAFLDVYLLRTLCGAMKGKKSAFAHTSTGYGKSKHSYKNNGGKIEKSAAKDATDKKKETRSSLAPEKDLNSGFGDYLRSPEAVEMMKLFVFANTIMLIVTMAWPNLKEQYYMLMHWLATFQSE